MREESADRGGLRQEVEEEMEQRRGAQLGVLAGLTHLRRPMNVRRRSRVLARRAQVEALPPPVPLQRTSACHPGRRVHL